ncbi:phosphatases II [Nadsonia fulvescens var. elongata DSM 6958]|uniref:phosphatidylinositol-3,4,5-trisphosphate 3-phosphatase n=1 Tax=Nadsonia fulvescens var. elongata DSM 6958 TaxID=857566 RepID=A0A1E3PHH5_9ASCO|nr:phosphatases II [Nadsonia fulvescens var. elongata DSM 6958]
MSKILKLAVSTPKRSFSDPLVSSALDMAYITPRIIVCAMPTSDFIKSFYRNAIPDLIQYLERLHQDKWKVWDFRGEGAGYDDHELQNEVFHFPFIDHNPAPFELILAIVASIHQHLQLDPSNTAILHCKAGKGRSGSMACAYLIAYHQYTAAQAMYLFTQRRMRPGFGEGVSILSQRRYLNYVYQWTSLHERKYWSTTVQLDAVIITFPRFTDFELVLAKHSPCGASTKVLYVFQKEDIVKSGRECIIFKPGLKSLVISDDLQLSFCRRVKGPAGFSIVPSRAYVWFNTYFETYRSESLTDSDRNTYRFKVKWCEMDGYKGLTTKGIQAFTHIELYWSILNNK